MNKEKTKEQPLQHLIEIRREKLNKILSLGINPYPNSFSYNYNIIDVLENFSSLKEADISKEEVIIKGRLILRREMGKSIFCHIQDFTGKIQIYFRKDIIGESKFEYFSDLVDIGDIIGVKGEVFRTKTGELTINVKDFTLLCKSLRPLPEKWHGLKDIETRYRQRYLDLIVNPDVKDTFIKRSKIITTIRSFLNDRGFLEVETPIIQSLPGGAVARPFKTYHNALGMDFYLRIAPELYLKMLIIGGMEKIYELGKSFRNEGIDRYHNPEFTMVEIYQAYADYNTMMELMKEIFLECCYSLDFKDKIIYKDEDKTYEVKIDSFQKFTMSELFNKYVKVPLEDFVEGKLPDKIYDKLGVEIYEIDESSKQKYKKTTKKIIDEIFEKYIQPNLIQPTFVIDYPKELSPLAKYNFHNKKITERFELYIATKEVANAYSELNDPIEQYERFLQQTTDEEKMALNLEFITALEYGMPPTGGLGVGIDRLCMLLTNNNSIRDVILFPLMKAK